MGCIIMYAVWHNLTIYKATIPKNMKYCHLIHNPFSKDIVNIGNLMVKEDTSEKLKAEGWENLVLKIKVSWQQQRLLTLSLSGRMSTWEEEISVSIGNMDMECFQYILSP